MSVAESESGLAGIAESFSSEVPAVEDPFLNVSEAAERLGVSAASLRKWSNDGLVPVYRTPGNQRRFRQSDLDGFLESMRQPQPE